MTSLQHFLILGEPLLLLLALAVYWKSEAGTRLRALKYYLSIRLSSTAVLVLLLNLHHFLHISARLQYSIYFFIYWPSYLADGIALFFVVQAILKQVMEPVPGLRQVGLMAFRWISVISVVTSVATTIAPLRQHSMMVMATSLQVMRCVSIMEICLLMFLALAIHALGQSFRSRFFGVSLAFGIQAATDLLSSALLTSHPSLASTVGVVAQSLTLVSLIVLTAYFVVPEAQAAIERVSIVVSPQMQRWNEIAKALGHSNPQVAVPAPTGYFLQDVERVVDRVLAKNLANPAK